MRAERTHPAGLLESLIQSVRKELALRIKKAEEEGTVPDEAQILIESRAVIVFGSKVKQEHIRKKWMGVQEQRMPKEPFTQLRNTGVSHMAGLIDKGVHSHTVCEVVDVHMTREAAARLRKTMEEKKDVQQDNAGRPSGELSRETVDNERD